MRNANISVLARGHVVNARQVAFDKTTAQSSKQSFKHTQVHTKFQTHKHTKPPPKVPNTQAHKTHNSKQSSKHKHTKHAIAFDKTTTQSSKHSNTQTSIALSAFACTSFASDAISSRASWMDRRPRMMCVTLTLRAQPWKKIFNRRRRIVAMRRLVLLFGVVLCLVLFNRDIETKNKKNEIR